MLQARTLLFTVVFGLAVCSLATLFHESSIGAQSVRPIEMHEARTADSDLEVRGVGTLGPRFLTRQWLEALPQVEALVKPEVTSTRMPPQGIRVRGVDLTVLEQALGIAEKTMGAEAVCDDGYTAPLPAEYVWQHHPILVLTVEGMTPRAWAETAHTSDMGPYFIAYEMFVPSFRVLSHEDRAQVPVQMVRLEFAPEKQMFRGILPLRTAGGTATQGFKIAQQNCFRCHNAAGYGGTKAGLNWAALAKDAREKPEYFARWVRDPMSVDPRAEMPPNPTYDRATLTALTRYFATIR